MEKTESLTNPTQKKNFLNILHINIQCISNKINELELYTARNKVDIICVNEHWLQSDDLAVVNIPYFKLGNFFCRTEHRHGGVCIYVRNSINFKALDLCGRSVELDIEVTGIECNKNIILSVYRSPAGSLENFIHVLSRILERYNNCNVIITGDFNVKFNTNDASALLLCNILRTFGIHPTNNQNTRNTACLDNIFISNSIEASIQVVDSFSSDHSGLFAQTSILARPTSGEKISFRPLTDIGLHMLYNCIEQVNWSFTRDIAEHVEMKTARFVNILTEAIDYCFPLKSKLVYKHKPLVNWYTDELHSMREKMYALNLFSRNYPGLVSPKQLIK